MKRTDPNRLSREQVLSAANLAAPEVRFLVSNYYCAQKMRTRADLQIRHLGDKDTPDCDRSPALLLQHWANTEANVEVDLKKSLEKFASANPVGRWLLAQHAIGPVIAAGLLAHIDIEMAPTVGHIWRYAGLDPTMKWNKSEKRPWNNRLKVICWHAGQCFKRAWKHPDCFYGHLYGEHKQIVVARNEAGAYAERTKTFYTNSADVKKTLKAGKLPDSNLDAQAARWAVKIFISHLHAVMYWDKFGKAPPKPFVISVLGHAHEIKVPNTDMFPGFEEAYYGIPTKSPAKSAKRKKVTEPV